MKGYYGFTLAISVSICSSSRIQFHFRMIMSKLFFYFAGIPEVSKFKRISVPDVDIKPAQYSFIEDQRVFKTDDTTLR